MGTDSRPSCYEEPEPVSPSEEGDSPTFLAMFAALLAGAITIATVCFAFIGSVVLSASVGCWAVLLLAVAVIGAGKWHYHMHRRQRGHWRICYRWPWRTLREGEASLRLFLAVALLAQLLVTVWDEPSRSPLNIEIFKRLAVVVAVAGAMVLGKFFAWIRQFG